MGTTSAMNMPECPRCGSWEFHDLTTLGERPLARLMCAECGSSMVMFREAPAIHALEGPSVPTPEDILHGAMRLLP